MSAGESIGQELLNAELRPITDALEKEGITIGLLAKKLKSELRAKKTNLQKLKGAPNGLKTKTGRNKSGIKVITTTGIIEYDDEDEKQYGTGESLLAVDMVDWGTRQKARIDAHRLRGDYPAEKHEHTGKDGGPIEHNHITEQMDMDALADAIKRDKKAE